MNTFVLTPAAEDDLAQIIAHVEGERPSAVVRVLGALEEATQLLADNPDIGHVRPVLTPLPLRDLDCHRRSCPRARPDEPDRRELTR